MITHAQARSDCRRPLDSNTITHFLTRLGRFVAATGTGPVDAVYKAIDKLIGISVELETYGMQAVNEGIDAVATTRVSISAKPDSSVTATSLHSQSGTEKVRQFSGAGSDGDVVVSSARAYVSALNKMIAWTKRRSEKEGAAKGEGEGSVDSVPLGDGASSVQVK